MRVVSFLVFTHHKRWSSFLCPSCTTQTGTKELGLSCAAGWWGFPWGILTFAAIWVNGKSLLLSNTAGRVAAILVLSATVGGFAFLGSEIAESRREEDAAKSVGDYVSQEAITAVEEGNRLLEAGQLEDALAQFEIADREAPSSASINRYIGLTQMQLGHTAEARRRLERSVSLDPSSPAARWYLSTACLMEEDYKAAVKHLRQLAERPDANLMFHERYQSIARSAEEFESAQSFYRDRAAEHPESGEALYLHAAVIDDLRERAQVLVQALEQSPDLRQARVALVDTLLRLRMFAEAELAVAELKRLPPEDETQAVDQATRVAFEQGELESALSRIDAAIAVTPRMSSLHLQKSQIHQGLGQFDLALDEIGKARGFSDPSDDVRLQFDYRQISCLTQKGDFEVAKAVLNDGEVKLAEAIPGTRSAIAACKGRLLLTMGDLEGAAAGYAVSTPEADGIAYAMWPMVEQSIVFILQGKFSKAEPVLAAVAEVKPARFDEHPLTAKFLLGGMTQADYLAATRRSGIYFDNDAWFHIGLRHETQGELAEAKKAYEKSLELSIGDNHPAQIVRARLATLMTNK